MPLVREGNSFGVFVVRAAPDVSLLLSQRDLIESFAAQLAIIVESEQLRAAAEREELLAESEKLHRTLLDGVSHELKTPLAVLSASAESMETADEPTRRTLMAEMRTAITTTCRSRLQTCLSRAEKY